MVSDDEFDGVAWYRRRAEARVKAGIDRWRPRFGGGEQFQMIIRDQRQRWGSCAPDGTLRFNWRVAMLKPDLAEYLVTHELAHLLILQPQIVLGRMELLLGVGEVKWWQVSGTKRWKWPGGPKALRKFMGALREGFTVRNPAGGRWNI